MNEVVKTDYMAKRSQMKSFLGKLNVNFKCRWFQLTSSVLRYCDGTIDTGPQRVKGQILLVDVLAVENADPESLGNKPNAFQIVYKVPITESELAENRALYIIAVHDFQKKEWMTAIRNACIAIGSLSGKCYHPGLWMGKSYSCCSSINKRSEGCLSVTDYSDLLGKSPCSSERRSLPVNNNNDNHSSNSSIQCNYEIEETFGRVLALYEYKAVKEGQLDLLQGEEYELLEDFKPDRFVKVRNDNGQVGLIPANYIQQKSDNSNSLEEYEWYYGGMSRVLCERTLAEDGREGCFVVRNSSKAGVYTLSVLIRKPNARKNSSQEQNDDFMTKHYHIQQNSSNCFYLADKHPFATIPQLIYYHKHNSAGLIVRLRCHPNDKIKPMPVWETMEIDRKDIELKEELGVGQFGKVMKGIMGGTLEVAVKTMKEGAMSELDFLDEARAMTTLNHPNLVKLYGVCVSTPLMIVTEFMKYGALVQYLKRNKTVLVKDLDKLLDMCFQICCGMQYLEQHNVIHRDLAARNCLVGNKQVVKICDFGLARHVLDDEYSSSVGAKFPVRWSSPEVMAYTKFSSKSDVWAFAVLMWEVYAFGKLPYEELKNIDVVELVCHQNFRLEKPQPCPENVFNLMSSCWAKEPEDRPTFSSLHEQLKFLTEN